MFEKNLGRLKHTLKERCPNCGKVLQLRARKRTQLVRGIEVNTEIDYICCSNCDYEAGVKKKGKNHPSIDKTAWKEEIE